MHARAPGVKASTNKLTVERAECREAKLQLVVLCRVELLGCICISTSGPVCKAAGTREWRRQYLGLRLESDDEGDKGVVGGGGEEGGSRMKGAHVHWLVRSPPRGRASAFPHGYSCIVVLSLVL